MSINTTAQKPFKVLNKYFKDHTDLADKITYGKTYKYSLDKAFIKPYLAGDRFIFQTPMLYIPYAPRQVDSYNSGGGIGVGGDNWQCDASLFNNEYDPDINEFQQWIKYVEDTVYKSLRKRSNLGITRAGHISLLKHDDYRDCLKLALKLDSKITNFFMLESQGVIGSKINFKTDLKIPCYAVFVIEVASIWIRKNSTVLDTLATNTNSTSWGISLVIHAAQCLHSHISITPTEPAAIAFLPNQSMINALNSINLTNTNIPPPPPPPPPLGLFIPNLAPASHTQAALSQIPDYLTPFMKMLKMGIPRDAVKHKMIMAGLDPDTLDNPTGGQNNISINTPGPVKITANMLTAVKLKKGVSDSMQHQRPKIARPEGAFEIKLDDILKIKERLKKSVDTGQDTYSKIFKPLDI